MNLNNLSKEVTNTSKQLCTIKVDNTTHNKLKKLKGRYTYQEYIKIVADYFEKTGIDPDSGEADIKTIVKSLIKETNRVIKVLRGKEREELKKFDEILDALTMTIYKMNSSHLPASQEKNTSPISLKNPVSNNSIEEIRRDIKKIYNTLNTKERCINLFQEYLKKQDWNKSTFGGKYVEDPTELNEEFLNKFHNL
ncbi:BfmA/BtgA family mobilization protein [Chondrinema litorale]|uniref:BfmA/BtgA family mobilization protein n=1 Tax=Chondrinema litorale TaxID=2994555 RepID=UPI00254314A8|nr:BfmA/BtgA family mobilization protein [Chondrinema litorale]UZS00036.1 BfmA/BtgA family mobilization protein [Chondrinema litorale]